ncbi:hypothetical protein ACFQ60_47690 [Streptomyces zhihengii]
MDGHVGMAHDRSKVVQHTDDPLHPEMDPSPDAGVVEEVGGVLGFSVPELLHGFVVAQLTVLVGQEMPQVPGPLDVWCCDGASENGVRGDQGLPAREVNPFRVFRRNR